MIQAIEAKLTELYTYLIDLKTGERGQTSAEYVAVTAVAVAIAIGVIYVTLGGALSAAVGDIGDAIGTFVDDEVTS